MPRLPENPPHWPEGDLLIDVSRPTLAGQAGRAYPQGGGGGSHCGPASAGGFPLSGELEGPRRRRPSPGRCAKTTANGLGDFLWDLGSALGRRAHDVDLRNTWLRVPNLADPRAFGRDLHHVGGAGEACAHHATFASVNRGDVEMLARCGENSIPSRSEGLGTAQEDAFVSRTSDQRCGRRSKDNQRRFDHGASRRVDGRRFYQVANVPEEEFEARVVLPLVVGQGG
jgi:hypothetical protein